ncbi:MAG TPA: hypothetical protein VGE99_02215 [Candidatus Dormibacteraeota bacterium]
MVAYLYRLDLEVDSMNLYSIVLFVHIAIGAGATLAGRRQMVAT